MVAADLDLTAQAEQVAAAKAEIRAQLVAALALGTHQIGEAKVIITQPLRWDAKGKDAFRKDYRPDEWPELYTLELNTKAIDNELAPVLVKSYKAKAPKQVRIAA